MFTAQQIKDAHSKVKTGAEYPAYIQELKQMGITHYDFFVKDGVNVYYGKNDEPVKLAPKYDMLTIAERSSSSVEILRHTIAIHQQGQTDLMTFCNQAANAGVDKWVSDLEHMVVIYIDKAGAEMLREPIPTGAY